MKPNKTKTKIIRIEFSKEDQDLITKIKNREPIKRTKICIRKHDGSQYEYATNKIMSLLSAHKRLVELFGGTCTGCGINWPDFKVMHDYGDERGGAWLVERYCQSCFDKQPVKDTYDKRHKKKEKSK